MPETAEIAPQNIGTSAGNEMHPYAQRIADRAPVLYAEMIRNRKENWLKKMTHRVSRTLFPPRTTQ